MRPGVFFRRLDHQLLDVTQVEMSELDHIAGLECVLRHFVPVDQNAVPAMEVTNSNALTGRNELGVPPRQQRIHVVQVTGRIAAHDDRADEQQLPLAAPIIDEQFPDNHARTACTSTSISAELW